MPHFRFMRGLAVALSCLPAGLRAEMTWSSYDTSGNRVSASAAVFDPASASYRLTIPANSTRVFVTTDFAPISVATPASGRVLSSVGFSLSASGGYGSGGSVQNKYTAFGLFSTRGTAPGATGNFTDDTGLWVTFYQQASGNFAPKPCSVKAAAPSCPASLLGLSSGTYGLGSANGGGTGLVADNQQVDVVLTLVHNAAGTWQLGNTTNTTATATTAPGVIFRDRATGGSALLRTTYSNTDSALSGPQTFDQFGFLFENGTASEVTLILGDFTLVGPPHVVTPPPASSSVTVGGTLVLSATAGGAVTGYQWEFSSDGGASYTPVSGADSASLTIADAGPADAGLYRLVVSNAVGSATSAPAEVSVTDSIVAPSVQTPPTGATILVGGAHTFSVQANGTSPLSYQWEKSGDGGANYVAIDGAGASSFTVADAALADDALYRVVVSNAAGSVASAGAALVVHEPPALTVAPVGAVLPAGSSHTLSVVATGTPAPTYQWKRDDIVIEGATGAELPLTLSAAVSGAYTVVVTNAAGAVVSPSVYVGVPMSAAPVLHPADDSVGANIDTPLSLTFAEAPVVGRTGRVFIHRADTDALVETIDLATLTEKRSTSANLVPQRVYRVARRSIGGLDFNYFPIVVTGNTARVYPKTKLEHGRSYYVKIEPGVILDAAGATLPAIDVASAWNFATKASGPAADAASLTVAADGGGDFSTVQGAIDFIPHSPANSIPRVITVRDGEYTELVHVRAGQNRVTIRGQSRGGTVVSYLNNGDIFVGQTLNHRGVFTVQAADFTLQNLTVRNLTPRYGSQAEAFTASNGIQRCVVSGVDLFSLQDTVLAGGQVYFQDCYIEGDVDFMWGAGGCFFQDCEIRSANPGYVTQIRSGAGAPGNIYVGCRFTAASGLGASTVALSRTDPNSYPHAQMVLVDCALGAHIKPSPWQLDGGATAAPNVRFWEYRSTDLAGALVDVSARPTYNAIATGVGSSTVLPHQQIDQATADHYRVPANVFSGWTPVVPATPTAYDDFATSHGLDPLTTGAPDADPDGDGLFNALEFALFGDPTAADAALVSPTLQKDSGDGLRFTYLLAVDASGAFSVGAELSSDLTEWSPAETWPGGASVATESVDAATRRVTVTIPAPPARVFARVRATRTASP